MLSQHKGVSLDNCEKLEMTVHIPVTPELLGADAEALLGSISANAAACRTKTNF